MGLSRRLQNQRDQQRQQRNNREYNSDMDDDLDALFGDEAPAKPQSKPKQAAKAPPESAVGQVQDILADMVPLTPQEVTDSGYQPPPKRVTPPHVAKLRRQLRPKLLAGKAEADFWDRKDPEKQAILEKRLQTVLKKMNADLSEDDYVILRESLFNDLMGFGAIEPLVQDRRYSEIMVNGSQVVFAEFKGKLTETEITFDDEDHVIYTAQRIVRPLMRQLDRDNPMVDARLPDGSRVHIVTAPSALNGTTITIRKFPEKRLTWEDLVKFGSFTKEVKNFLEACVVARLNIVISGGTGSGKTTLLNVMSSFIPDDERIVTIEDAAELDLAQRHVVSLETAPPVPLADGGDGKKGVLTVRDLVKGSLRMRPDRLVIGEVRGGEALDMLQAMNTGHDGSLTTVHSNSARDAIARLETLCMMSGMELPLNVIRQQIASAVDVFVQQMRLKDGSRKIVQVTELQGMEGEQVTLQDIFLYRTENHSGAGFSHEGGGDLEPTGFRPKFSKQLEEYGFKLGGSIFGVGR
jgi:pilus assembly protein CpaF